MQQSKVRMVQALAGNDFTYQAGDEVTLPAGVAERWVQGGLAVFADEKAEGEKPSAPPALTAERATSRKANKAEKR